ncbi:MAG: trypsin-like peptidase domain-containing protein [Bacteroidetes bacterium]|nr:trypsin-like peptidase domain-containing protein [Bacteroidota bacterium]
MMKKILIITVVFILGGVVFLLTAGTLIKNEKPERIVVQREPIPVQHASLFSPLPIDGPDFTKAAAQTVDAVVHIRSQFRRKSNVYDDFFGTFREYFGYGSKYEREYPISGWGSGVIITSDGYIVTNNHVVQGAELVEVTLNDKHTYEAEIIGTDVSTDLALIKIDSDDLPFISYGNSDDVRVGEWVLAIGNPFNLTSTVTAGIVSAKARNINILGSQSSIESFIQTDAAVNRGNSGGALVNIEGKLIGINAAIASNTGYYTGYSFAIPVNIVRKVMDDLLIYGEVQRAYIGIIIREIDNDFAQEQGFDDLKGIYVEEITDNGGAQAAGIREGDIIKQINGKDVNSFSQLLELVSQHRPGDVVPVNVNRNNKIIYFNVELKNEDGTTSIVKKEDKFYNDVLGATLKRISDKDKQTFMINNGLKVTSTDNGVLKSGGIRNGFIITRINDIRISTKDNLEKALNESDDFIKIQGIYPNGMRVTYEFSL